MSAARGRARVFLRRGPVSERWTKTTECRATELWAPWRWRARCVASGPITLISVQSKNRLVFVLGIDLTVHLGVKTQSHCPGKFCQPCEFSRPFLQYFEDINVRKLLLGRVGVLWQMLSYLMLSGVCYIINIMPQSFYLSCFINVTKVTRVYLTGQFSHKVSQSMASWIVIYLN